MRNTSLRTQKYIFFPDKKDVDGAHPGRASNGCRKEMQKTSGKEENSILYFREHT